MIADELMIFCSFCGYNERITLLTMAVAFVQIVSCFCGNQINVKPVIVADSGFALHEILKS